MSSRSRFLGAGAATAIAIFALTTAAQASKTASHTRADSGTAWFSITHTVGSTEYAAGTTSDKLLGTDAVTYTSHLLPNSTGAITVNVKRLVVYSGTGSMVGTATAQVTVSGTTETISDGKLKLTKGFGSMKGDKLIATLSGTGNLAANQIKFTYKGKLTTS
jgi:hypothetical protein